jgi:protein involved in polysaccharide export with SLBB domain
MVAEPLGDYRLRSGDVIQLRFYNHPELSEGSLKVGPDGKISLQLLDEVLVAGLTTFQVDELLSRDYERHLTNVNITVGVQKYSGLKAYVGGEVGSPGFVSLEGNMSVLQAVLARSGFMETAKTENVILLRKGPGNRPVAMVVDLEPVISGEQIENDIYLMPSDIVYVPKTSIAKAGDFVTQYMRRVFMLDSVIRGAGSALGWSFVRSDIYDFED